VIPEKRLSHGGFGGQERIVMVLPPWPLCSLWLEKLAIPK
jgi:hypothetical protein